ncbi:hypothetical protein BGP_2997 [Beggiatoa sp. PS]|nr:hypothetical protein BGP_2997 [Beggiatoa sp. PS]
MATRTIKTIDGTEHSGDSSDFTDYYSHVEYRDASETKIIYLNNIVSDSTVKNWSETMMPLKIGVMAGIITFLLLLFVLNKFSNNVQAQLPTAEKEKTTQVVPGKSEQIAKNETQKATKNKTHKLEQELQKFLEQELDELLAQKYIDPLTNYIRQHQKDNLRKSYVQQVIKERNRRCAETEKRFQKQPKNARTLVKLTKGYNYSCPDVITQFAQRI